MTAMIAAWIAGHLSWLAPHLSTGPAGWWVYWDGCPHVAAGFGWDRPEGWTAYLAAQR